MEWDEASEAAALWGTAKNQFYSEHDRLACALKALEFFGNYYEEHEEMDENSMG